MILLDTNVLSEVLRPTPSAAVVLWLAAQEPLSVFTTAVTQAEILYGVAQMPRGKRQVELAAAIERMFEEEFRGRILGFDEQTAPVFAAVAAARKAAGRPIAQMDCMIAAVARRHRAELATRNVSDFDGCDIKLVDPWTARVHI